MSGCALFSATIKNSDRCWFARSRVEMALKDRWKFCRGQRSRGAPAGLHEGALENYVACLAGTLILATCNLRLKSQSPVTLRDIVRRGR